MYLRTLLAACIVALSGTAALADPPPATAPAYRPNVSLQPSAIYDAAGNIVSFGASSSAPTFTTPAGVTRARLTCTLPAYATGGNIVCTNEAGQQTTTACAANAACLVIAANSARKVAEWTNRTAGSTIDVGYSATVAPGNSKGYDGPATTNGQGGSGTENPAHVGTYYAASATAGAVLVFVQGQ